MKREGKLEKLVLFSEGGNEGEGKHVYFISFYG